MVLLKGASKSVGEGKVAVSTHIQADMNGVYALNEPEYVGSVNRILGISQ